MIRLPDFIGIGAQKAASTWLYECLRKHPDICMADRKEVRFFDNEQRFQGGIEAYGEWFSKCEPNQLAGEFTPTYLHDPKVPQRIWECCGNVKLIVCLRDPIDRLESHVKHRLRNGSFRTNLISEVLRDSPGLIDKSKYYEALSNFLYVFDIDKIHILLYEDLIIDPLPVIGQLYSFLGVDPSFVPDDVDRTVGQGYVPRLRSLERMKRNLFSLLTNYTVGNRVIQAIRDLRLNRLYRRLNSKNLEIEYDDPSKDELMEIFRDEYDRLPELIGRSLNVWIQKEPSG